jgi:hypothetical protein
VQFHLIGVPGILALVCAWSLAGVVLLTGPGLQRDRLLALLLFVEGGAWGSGAGFLYMTTSASAAWAFQSVFCFMLLALPGTALAFAGTLPSTFMVQLRSKAGRLVLLFGTLAAEVWYLSNPSDFIGEIVPAWYATWDAALPERTVNAFNIAGLASVVSLFGALTAWRQSERGTWARSQAKAFALAFAVHDIGLFFALVLPGHFLPPPPSGYWTDILVIVGCSGTSLLFVMLLAYGILKVQLFDVDLRIKRGLRRSTIAAVFVFVFLVVEQLVSNYFNGQFGVLLGAVVAGLMLFGLDHIRNFAGKIAHEAMPSVSPTPEYVAYRKLEVYRAAFEGLYADTQLNDKERATLERLRLKLGIQPGDAAALEAEIREEMGGAAFRQGNIANV